MIGQFEFRELLLKIQDLLSDNDRQRLHFLLGDDVPRNLRDDPSLGGTLRVLQSLFDKSIINDQDCIYLIEALKKIRCYDAAKRLQEYQQTHGQLDQQNLSLTDILWKDNEEDKVIMPRSAGRPLNMKLTDIKIVNETSDSPASDTEQQKKRTLTSLFLAPISCRESVLLVLLLLALIAIPLATRPWRKSTDEKIIRIDAAGTAPIQQITINARWSPNGVTVMGGHGPGNEPNQLHNPGAIDIDQEDTIYITDDNNHRIMEKKSNATSCRVVAGGNGPGLDADQLNVPTGVLVEKVSESLIVCDHGNQRLMRWSLRTGTSEEMILGDISCRGLAMDASRFLYVSSDKKSEIRRFRLGERNGTVMADGDGKANSLDRFLAPNFFTFDSDSSLYISDVLSNRVTKWTPGAKEGIVVAGNSDEGVELDQLSRPFGIVVDRLKTVYVVDSGNDRIMRWAQDATEGEIIIGGNGRGMGANQLNNPVDIAMDRQGNLFVTDYNNHRLQKFNVEHY